jgi:hypothetical protein
VLLTLTVLAQRRAVFSFTVPQFASNCWREISSFLEGVDKKLLQPAEGDLVLCPYC